MFRQSKLAPNNSNMRFAVRRYSTGEGATKQFIKKNSIQQQKINDMSSKDHREINKVQKLFLQHPCSPATPLILPHGMRVINAFKNVLRHAYSRYGYEEVQTPVMLSSSLWKTSGHLDQYASEMFFVQQQQQIMGHGKLAQSTLSEISSNVNTEQQMGLKPMNCPSHCVIYQSESRSYRDLPIKLADFSPLHRNELSGALTGLTRLRQFHQDDAHIFCTPEQTYSCMSETVQLIKHLYANVFKFQRFDVVLSTRPESGYIGDVQSWDLAESILSQVLNEQFPNQWEVNSGDGSFYGPKIDFRVSDAANRQHQLGTVQLDFQLPQQFQLEYVDSDQQLKRPVLIHRAICGSLERFMAIYAEYCQGKWPLWCSPRQILIIPVYRSDQSKATVMERAKAVKDQLAVIHPEDPMSQQYFIDIDDSDELLQKKIAVAHELAYNYLVVVGERECESGRLAVRGRSMGNRSKELSIDEFRTELNHKLTNFE
ncbi:hypothetical protein MIR68_002962 [Amoeboaphelidium protococcarum]|nr:hypothetical protein MIR68_002962 [Amoeboaphelidium protococcarum]